MGDDHLEEVLIESQELSEDQNQTNQRYEKNINELLEQKNKVVYDVRKTIRSLRAAADEVDHIQWDGDITRAAAYGSGVIGGLSTVGAGVAILMTWGGATPLLFAGAFFGGCGAITHLAGNAREAYKKSSEIERAEKDWKQASDTLRRFIKKIEDMKNEKKGSILNAVYAIPEYLNPALKLPLSGYACYKGKEVVELMKKGIKEATKGSADDVAKAATKSFIKTNAQVLTNVMIGVGAGFMIWDTVNMYISIKDVVFKRKSKAAKVLREKADDLEHYVQFLK